VKHYHPRAIGNTHAVALSLLKPSGGRVLDAAAGDRWVSRSLAEMGFDVTSADIEFTDRPLPANCVEANLNERLPFEASSFDGVVSIETIEHLENPWFFLRELSRILRPGGFLILSTPNVSSVFSRVLNAATGKLLWFQPRDLDPLGHITPIHWHLLTEMARRASLQLEQRQYTWARIPILNATLRIRTAFLGECVVARFSKRAD
jgi:SAM-dependent methyltransferase